MRSRIVIVAVLALALTAGGALAKGGPPAKPPKGPKQDHAAAQGQKRQDPAAAKPDRGNAKQLSFKREARRLGYTCRGGTTRLAGIVDTVVPAASTATGSLTLTVAKGNSRARALAGTQVTVTLLTSTEVVRKGVSAAAALATGDTVRIDARTCTAPDAGVGTDTNGSAAAVLLARRIVAR